MFKTVVVTEDAPLARAIEDLAQEPGLIRILKTIDRFPSSEYEVARLVTQNDPELVLLHANSPELPLEIGLAIRARFPEIALIVISPPFPEAMEASRRRAGIELLKPPLSSELLNTSVRNAIHCARPILTRHLLLFVPAKAGNGASTVALNVASALAQGLSKRVLLLEADLRSGVLSLALNVKPRTSLIDLLHKSSSIDFSVWEKAILHLHSLDLLPADRSSKLPPPSWVNYHQLLKFAAPRYDRVLVDLPEVVNDATADLVHYANTVFVVCTPELPSLTLAEQRLKELYVQGLPPGRAEIIVNRWHKSDISVSEVEDLLQSKVAAVFQNDYRAVHDATLSGSPVKGESLLGKAFLDFAFKLEGLPPVEKTPRQSSLGLLKSLRSSRA